LTVLLWALLLLAQSQSKDGGIVLLRGRRHWRTGKGQCGLGTTAFALFATLLFARPRLRTQRLRCHGDCDRRAGIGSGGVVAVPVTCNVVPRLRALHCSAVQWR